jgi:4-hydroxythreonine-4-phosphate dehydrogenase
MLAISIGCPSGVGPEVSVVAAAKSTEPCLLIGDEAVILRAAKLRRVARRRLEIWDGATSMRRPPRFGKPSKAAGAAQLRWIDEATDLVTRGVCSALVTAPVSKEAIAASGVSRGFRGHTEHLAKRLDAREVVMAFVGPRITTALVTTHLPLRRVARAITSDKVATSCYWLARLVAQLGRSGTIAVAALNPHAGEGGLLGDEERTVITPGVAVARRRIRRDGLAVDLVGPMGAETAFRRAATGDFVGVVAMYHDQATIPCKLLDFGEAVNVSLGLPIVRTSVDHGTAYDVAGSGRASARGMREALSLAATLVNR